MASGRCFVTATRGNVTINKTVYVNNGPFRRATRHTGNTVREWLSNSRIHHIKFRKASRKVGVQSEEKRLNETGKQNSLLICPGLCNSAQIFFFPSVYHWQTAFGHKKELSWLSSYIIKKHRSVTGAQSVSPQLREVPALGRSNSEKTNVQAH